MQRIILSIIWLATSAAVGPAGAGDWPQILGPERNGIAAADERLVDAFPQGGPKTLWQRPVGQGFAGPAVADGTLVLFHRVGDRQFVEAMDPLTGKVRWKSGVPTSFRTAFSDDNGPRCVPLIHEGRVYVFGAQGGLRCLQISDGKILWTRTTHEDFDAAEGYFGAGSTPIVTDGKLLVNVGAARTGAGIVAFDTGSGKTLWKVLDDTASYSSPVAATIDGVKHVIFITRLSVVSVDPATGSIRFRYPFGQRGPTVNAASPLVLDGHLFTTAHYGVGAVWSKIGKASVERLWASDETLSAHYTTPIAIEGKLYGIHGQERIDEPELRSIDPQSGKVLWSERGVGYGSLLAADGKLLVLTTDGELVLVKPDPARYHELARARLFDSTTRALPALADGLLYARGERTLRCIDLRP
ncbi:MAG: PQQ-binding-like beta-propeller repeat protein [Planctomycetes bacterium]|nr:PQQ-binding-like beta-propeller repeat protein [Planctomycetota bacterium]